MNENYLSEEELIEKMQSGDKKWLFYVQHHSREMKAEFEAYCHEHSLKETDDTAEQFIEMKQ